MINLNDMKDDLDYDDVAEDTQEEMENYGKVIRVVAPKPNRDGSRGSGVGKVYVKFENNTGAKIAKEKMRGRLFEGKPVIATFYLEEKFDRDQFE